MEAEFITVFQAVFSWAPQEPLGKKGMEGGAEGPVPLGTRSDFVSHAVFPTQILSLERFDL